jgi:hypothetical protein
VKFLVFCLLACLGASLEAQSSGTPPDLVLDAGHCLATAGGDWLGIARENPYALELGYASGSVDSLYLIDFTTPMHSQGLAFAFQTHGKGLHRELTLEFRTRFEQAVDGTQRVTLIHPPLGGIGTQDEIVAAIQRVGFHTWQVPVADLRNDAHADPCATAGALR